MSRRPKPWYWKVRKCWFVQFNRKQIRLDPDETTAWRIYGRMLAADGQMDRDEVSRMTVPLAVDLFLDPVARPGRAPKTVSTYKKMLEPFAVAFQHKYVRAVSHRDVIEYCSRDQKWSDGYRHSIFSICGTLFRWCRDKGYLDVNPLAGAKSPWPQSKRKGVIERDQFDKLLAVIPDAEFRLLERVLYFSGCRPGEAYKLKPRHLDPSKNQAVLNANEHKTGHRTGQPRTIRFPADVMAELRAIATNLAPDDVLLRNTKGRPWNDFNVAVRFRRALKRAGLPAGLVPYNNRHSFGSGLVNAGFSTTHVARAMGHVTDHKLQEVYFHEEAKQMNAMIEQWAVGQQPDKPKQADVLEQIQALLDQLRHKESQE
jgi:integrase